MVLCYQIHIHSLQSLQIIIMRPNRAYAAQSATGSDVKEIIYESHRRFASGTQYKIYALNNVLWFAVFQKLHFRTDFGANSPGAVSTNRWCAKANFCSPKVISKSNLHSCRGKEKDRPIPNYRVTYQIQDENSEQKFKATITSSNSPSRLARSLGDLSLNFCMRIAKDDGLGGCRLPRAMKMVICIHCM